MGNGITAPVVPTTVFSPLSAVPAAYAQSIQNLLLGNKWGYGIGTGVNLTYSFSNYSSVFNYTTDGMMDLKLMTGTQQSAAVAAMALWANVANIAFSEVADTPVSAGDIRWNATTSPLVSTAYAIIHPNEAAHGDMWFGPNEGGYNSSEPGSYSMFTYLHELGHVLGLDHPHESVVVPVSGEDQLKYSVMSYRSYAGDSVTGSYSNSLFPITPMLNDIAALQYLYGANTTYQSGNDTYIWSNGQKIFETIWDGGGNDTIDASNQTEGVVIYLTSGKWSQIGSTFWNGQGYVRDCLTIAYNAVIENAKGTNVADTLEGNSAANLLEGMAGNDRLSGLAGDDVLNGGIGADSMLGGAGNDTYYVDNTGDKVYETVSTTSRVNAGGTDEVISTVSYALGNYVENLTLATSANVNGTGNALNNTVVGGSGINILNGGTGADVLNGRGGNDKLTGGTGTDIFVFDTMYGTSNIDTIIDFKSVDDTIQLAQSIFASLNTGILAAESFVVNTTGIAADVNDFIVYNKSSGALYYDADGSGISAAVQIALLGTSTHPAIANHDFLIS